MLRAVKCYYGCKNNARYIIGKSKRPCCSDRFSKCPAYREKARKSKLGENNPFYGKKHDQAFRDRMKENKGEKNYFYGKKHSIESKKAISDSRKGKCTGISNINYNKPRTEEVKKKISDTRVKLGIAKGELNPNWRHGKTKSRKGEMSTTKYKNWRKEVFIRDNYTCQHCGKRGGYLEADHVKPWAYFEELRYEVNNGRTLCLKCHRKIFKEVFQCRKDIKQ